MTVTIELAVSRDGTIIVPAELVASSGLTPGQSVSITLGTGELASSRGLLRGLFPSISLEEFEAAGQSVAAEFDVLHQS